METLTVNIKQRLIFMIFLTSLLLQLHSQSGSDEDIHRKYWYYKSHLNNDFIKVGLGLGESIPFNEKNSKHTNPSATVDLGGAPKLHAGDATARLGIYLSVLATEYRLLKNNNQDVSKVKHELFCALNAINRLDFFAETYFGAPTPQNVPSLNGFFVRDDIPGNFVANNYQHFNYNNSYQNSFLKDSISPYDFNLNLPSTILQDHGFTKTDLSGVYRTASSWSSTHEGDTNVFTPNYTTYKNACLGFEESMDQAFYLLMGLTLTSKLVDIGDSDNGAVFPITATTGQISIRNEAKEIATRLLQHITNDPLLLIRNPANKFSTTPAVGEAQLANAKPALKNFVNNLGANETAANVAARFSDMVQTGQWALPYAYAIDNWGNFIKHGQSMPYFWFNPGTLNNTLPFGTSPFITQLGGYMGNLTTYPFTQSFDFRGPGSVISVPLYQAMMNSGFGPRVDFQGFGHVIVGSSNTVYDQMTVVNLTAEAAIASLNLAINYLNGSNADLDRADSIATARLPTNAANAVSGLISAIKAAKQAGLPQLAAAISTGANYILQFIKQFNQYLFDPILKNVSDERLYLNSLTNPVYYSVDTSCNVPTTLVKIGSDQVFGIYLRNVLHPVVPNPPAGFRWLNTLLAPSRLLIKNQVFNELQAAPCNGNFNFGTGFMPPDPWGSSCIIDRFDATWKKTTCVRDINKGEYSGLDFLLLHNLYYLTEHPNTAGIKDYIDRNLAVKLPVTVGGVTMFGVGSNQTFGAFERITARDTLNPGAVVTLRAGKSVKLLPGFKVSLGAVATINNTPYGDCDWNSFPTMSRQANTINLNSVTSIGASQISNTKVTDIKTIDLESKAEAVSIFPNPNQGLFTVQFNLKETQRVSLSVVSVLGELIYSDEIETRNSSKEVLLPPIAKGMYLFVAKLKDGTVFQKRLITN